jgi:pyruvate/2-oxoglutarate dehydrogenase complex dihydrolipoamide dehydrogenase (E3) component
MSDLFDVIVIGAGPAGETVATRLCKAGMRTALVERELVGGECAYWACIPSKTLLRCAEVREQAPRTAGTARPDRNWEQITAYRDFMIRELDDSDEVDGYRKRGVQVFKGPASIDGPGRVRVGVELLRGERLVIATGSQTTVPDIAGLEQAGYWTNRDALTLREVPASVCVLGGGPVGIELAQLLNRLGSDVHLVEQGSRLLGREEPEVSRLIRDALSGEGISIHLDAEIVSVRRDDGHRVVQLRDADVECEQVLVATSREPRVADLALDRLGIGASRDGIEVDDRCRAGTGIWAVGDVTGVMPFTHVAEYQARVACADILGEDASADYTAIPRAVFCDPEVAAVGLTKEEARRAGIDIATTQIELRDAIARPWTFETDPRGTLGLVVYRDRPLLAGAWLVAPLASEWIHYAALAIKAKIPLNVLRDTVPQFPTYTEAFLKALDEL